MSLCVLVTPVNGGIPVVRFLALRCGGNPDEIVLDDGVPGTGFGVLCYDFVAGGSCEEWKICLCGCVNRCRSSLCFLISGRHSSVGDVAPIGFHLLPLRSLPR